MKMTCLLLAILAVALAFARLAPAQSAACGPTASNAELSQCAEARFQAAEAELTRLYARILDEFSSTQWTPEKAPGLPASERKEQLRWNARMSRQLAATQQQWLRYRNASCALVLIQYEGGSGAGLAFSSCNETLTRQRIHFLTDSFPEADHSPAANGVQ